jgi:restriction system protein
MAIPDYQTIMLPLLRLVDDEKVHQLQSTIAKLADEFGLTDEERKEVLPSGKQSRFSNRVGWARTYLAKAGLLSSPKRGHFQITPRGLEVLRDGLTAIDNKYLDKFQDFQDFVQLSKHAGDKASLAECARDEPGDETPEERLEAAYLELRATLAAEMLETIKQCTPPFFEQLVVDLLVKMGYGGSRREAGQAIGRSGDEGIDGIIKEDRLGLDIIYVQAKRWQSPIGRPELQKFAGALMGQGARKGVFITTSTFTKEATAYADRIDAKIILIDGERLTNYMIDHNVGVTTEATYELKRIDSDYFSEE